MRKPQVWVTGLIASFLISLVYLGIGRFPKFLRYAVLWVLGKLIFRLWKSRRERIIQNLFLVKPSLVDDPEKAAWKNFSTLIRAWSSLLSVEKVDHADLRNRITGLDALLVACDQGEVVSVFPHVGDLNSLTAVLAAIGREAFIPAEGIHPILYKAMAGLRARHGNVEFAPIKKGQTKEVCFQKLSEGKIVGLAMDMTTQPGKGVPFSIGKGTADFRVGAVEIAMKRRAAFFLVFPHWDGKKMFLQIEPFDLDYNLSIDENVRAVLAKYSPYLQANVLLWWRLSFMELRPAADSHQELGFIRR